ncbi:MAG: L,D-transpeptidase [Solirubrobacterales bacterium]|nr:L,D-transpeptidase [Solirubrobacterales bacterium]
MAHRSTGSEKRVVLVAVFVVSLVVAALLSSRVLSSRILADGPPTPPPANAGTPLASLPGAFDIHRLIPLSDPTADTRWAPVLRATVARGEPSPDGSAVGQLPSLTPDGTTNIVVAKGEADVDGTTWVRVGLSILPNDAEGWVPRSSLGAWSFVDTRLVIDRARLTATLYRGGRVIFHAPVGVGAPGTQTPAGQFYVRDRLSGFSSPIYGPLAFGTNARSPSLTDWPGGGVVGIHGTDQPGLIPGRISHGCVRLTNAAILKLGKLMPVGTPVTIE